MWTEIFARVQQLDQGEACGASVPRRATQCEWISTYVSPCENTPALSPPPMSRRSVRRLQV